MVDALGNNAATMRAKLTIQAITDKPVSTLIYTRYYHLDHTGDAQVFVHKQTEIIAAKSQTVIYGSTEFLKDISRVRLIQQFGSILTPEKSISAGLRPVTPKEGSAKPVGPAKWIKNKITELEIDGINLALYVAPGETDDQMYFWFPQEEILCCVDDYYCSWTNLSTSHGS